MVTNGFKYNGKSFYRHSNHAWFGLRFSSLNKMTSYDPYPRLWGLVWFITLGTEVHTVGGLAHFSNISLCTFPLRRVSQFFLQRKMRLQLLLWLIVNGSPVQTDCDPSALFSNLQLCVQSCFTNPSTFDTCYQKCQITKSTAERECNDQIGNG